MKDRMLVGRSAAVVGAGGLGCTVLYCLAAAGLGRITVVDGDRVEESNLNRQLLYGYGDIGGYKAELAAKRLTEQYPGLSLEHICEAVDEGNAQSIIKGHDIVLSCVDSIEARLTLNRAAAALGIPLTDAGISGYSGRVMSVMYGETPCLECLFGSAKGEKQPVLGACVVAVGALQAKAAIALLEGRDDPTLHGMLMIDLMDYHFDLVPVKRTPGCPACGKKG